MFKDSKTRWRACVFVLFETMGVLVSGWMLGGSVDWVLGIVLAFVLVYDMSVYMLLGDFQDHKNIQIIYPFVNIILSVPVSLVLFVPYDFRMLYSVLYDFYAAFWPLVAVKLVFAIVYAAVEFRAGRVERTAL